MISAQERKAKTEAHLKRLGIRVNSHLPCIENVDEIELRSGADIAQRILIVLQIVAVSHGQDRLQTISWLQRENLYGDLSCKEVEFLQNNSPSQDEVFDAQWQIEAAKALVWGIGRIPELGLPDQLCEASDFLEGIPLSGDNSKDFIEQAEVRKTEEILDMADMIYRVHWMTRDEWVNGGENSLNLNDNIALMWHRALSWIIGLGETWDDADVST